MSTEWKRESLHRGYWGLNIKLVESYLLEYHSKYQLIYFYHLNFGELFSSLLVQCTGYQCTGYQSGYQCTGYHTNVRVTNVLNKLLVQCTGYQSGYQCTGYHTNVRLPMYGLPMCLTSCWCNVRVTNRVTNVRVTIPMYGLPMYGLPMY